MTPQFKAKFEQHLRERQARRAPEPRVRWSDLSGDALTKALDQDGKIPSSYRHPFCLYLLDHGVDAQFNRDLQPDYVIASRWEKDEDGLWAERYDQIPLNWGAVRRYAAEHGREDQ